MNKKILETLEFQKIKQLLLQSIRTALGEEEVKNLTPSCDFDQVTQWLEETKDGFDILRLKGGIPIPKVANIKPHMKRIEIGAMLNGLEIAQVGRVLQTALELNRFFDELKEEQLEVTRLYYWVDQLEILPQLTRTIKVSVEEDGRVTDEASPELRGIRQQIRRTEQTIREQLDQMIKGKQAKYLSDSLVTMRNERYVIPVKAEYKGVFGGVVHDQSASGQTLFIEPRQIVDLNNRLRQHQIAERQEVERILANLSNELAPHYREILHNARVIGHLDFIEAKAEFGKALKATVPHISETNALFLKSARHPLIDADLVVANDITIGENYQTIVITGPNTGGKTITLKTLGLMQLMGQSGLPLTVKEDSQIGIFQEIFADIGDEQSIEQNLSTFSSHMTNIVDILRQVDDKSLVLFDELGAGTDPQEGAALAISILDDVAAKGAYVVATTHYPELKIYGYNRPGTINASMEFNVDTLSPTYKLLIGVPGRSNAFEISRRLGLENHVIEASKSLIDEESQDLNEMIADLESRRKMAETEYLEVRHFVEESESLYEDLKAAYEFFFEERETELAKAKRAANEIVEEAETKAEKIIADIRNMQLASGSQSGHVKEHELIEAKSKIRGLYQEEERLKTNKVLKKAKEKKVLKPGDEVLVESFGQYGTLIEKLPKNEWLVQLGILKMNIKENQLVKSTENKEEPKQVITTVRTSTPRVSSQLDLRGRRFDDAIHEVDQYLDDAILAGYSQVTIVHGKGTGALRQGITDYLKKHPRVKKVALAPYNQGGSGATIVEFK